MASPTSSSEEIHSLPTLMGKGSEQTGPEPPEPPTLPYRQSLGAGAWIEPGKDFGDYTLIKEIGRGGMGVVFKARQISLDRIVAVKMILPGPRANADDLARFRLEAEANAQLRHPNIVTVHEVGEIHGQPFYSMDFVEGSSLSQRLAQGPLPSRQAARYVLTIARALHYAHCHGIVHRDIKPSNILLDANDEPHVTDFGLAKRLGSDSGHTRTGAVMGTPSYMAPEQAAGKTKELGPPCDIYGVGAVLYELLTGRPPFRSDTPVDTIMHVLERDPAPPRLLNPKVDRDLETICLKCLEKNPKQRYVSADALAADLNQYLNGESISARSFNMLDRLSRTLDRSHYDVEFQNWGSMLLWFSVMVFTAQLATFAVVQVGAPRWCIWICRALEFVFIGLVFWRHRRHNLWPTSTAERQLWTIWIGYLAATVAVFTVVHILFARDILSGGVSQAAARYGPELCVYPIAAILSGVGFFVMGSNYWGRCYILGLGFFALAVAMTFSVDWAPFEFGVAWGTTLAVIGWRLRSLSQPVERDLGSELSLPAKRDLERAKDPA
jgi:serine/threonine-protein kinase